MNSRLRHLFDIDQLLIFFLLAVTINQMGHYLSTFAPEGLGFVGYLQAIAIDAAIWRSAYWFRRYGGTKQRRWAAIGVVMFAAVSTWYNQAYYGMKDASLPAWQPWVMGAVLPVGVALLSFLYGVKASSRFSGDKEEHPVQAENVTESVTKSDSPKWACKKCGYVAGNRFALAGHQRLHSPNVKRKEKTA